MGKGNKKHTSTDKLTKAKVPTKALNSFEKFLKKRNWTKKRQMDLQNDRDIEDDYRNMFKVNSFKDQRFGHQDHRTAMEKEDQDMYAI